MLYGAKVPEEVLARLMVDQARAQEEEDDSDSDITLIPIQLPKVDPLRPTMNKGKTMIIAQKSRLSDHIASSCKKKPEGKKGREVESTPIDIQGLVFRQEWTRLEQLSDSEILQFGLDRLEKLLHLQGGLLYGESRLQRLRSAFQHENKSRKKSMLGRYALFRAAAMDGVTLPQEPTSKSSVAEETCRPSPSPNQVTPALAGAGANLHMQRAGARVVELAKSVQGYSARRMIDGAFTAR